MEKPESKVTFINRNESIFTPRTYQEIDLKVLTENIWYHPIYSTLIIIRYPRKLIAIIKIHVLTTFVMHDIINFIMHIPRYQHWIFTTSPLGRNRIQIIIVEKRTNNCNLLFCSQISTDSLICTFGSSAPRASTAQTKLSFAHSDTFSLDSTESYICNTSPDLV